MQMTDRQAKTIAVALFCVVATAPILCWLGDSVLFFFICALCGMAGRLSVNPTAYGPSPLFDASVVTALYALSHAPQLLSALTRCVCYAVLGIVAVDLYRIRKG
jgi:hypothetical protein